MSVIEGDFNGMGQGQPTLFELPPLDGGGAVTLSSVKAVPLEHSDTAVLLKSKHMGVGTRVTGTFEGDIGRFTVDRGTITWTVQVDSLQVEV